VKKSTNFTVFWMLIRKTTMAVLGSWLSPDVMGALGWALIHSLWQCLAVAALAAAFIALSRRPSFRYLVATAALFVMLAVPVSTFFLLMRTTRAPTKVLLPATSGSLIAGVPKIMNAPAATATSTANGNGAAGAFLNFSHIVPSLHGLALREILPWLVGAWLCGVALFSLRLAGGVLLLEQRRHRRSCAPSPRILAMCRELQHQLGLNRAIRYLECSWLQAPAAIGWFRPIILLPVTALTGLSEEQLRAVIAHELSHIRRLDAVVNLFQILVETLLFYHPAMWWLNRRIRTERELCCDEIAVSLTGNRLEYARALTRMAEWKSAPILAMAANRGPLSQRILHILGQKSFGAGQRIFGLTGAAIFMIAALVAANALFGIAYPIPVAHASETTKFIPASSLVTGELDAPKALQASEPPTKMVDKTPDQTNRSDATGHEAESVTPDKIDPVTIREAESVSTPSQVAALQLLPIQQTTPAAAVTSNDLPSGVHDPDALTCDAPQLVPLAKVAGWKVCVQNSIVETFSETGALSPGGRIVRSFSDLPISRELKGAGDPDSVTCVPQPAFSGLPLLGPIACAHNDFWVKLNAAGCILSPDLRVIIRSGTTKNLNPLACTHIMGRNGILPPRFF
jgi:beta-lactamase regulating signal transducer with metallopeptidase domain